MKRISVLVLAVVGCMALMVAPAGAALVNLGPGSFTPAASVITFSEPGYPLGMQNPTYHLGGNTVRFGTNFSGQTVSGGGVRTLTGAPTGPLTLVYDVDNPTFIANDGANPTSPTLSGTPLFNGPISVMFDTPVAAVGLSGGYFDAIGATTIEAYGADGGILGSITNSQTGIEFYGLFDNGGANIAGISFYITGNEPAGFVIDNFTFGNADVIRGVPEPGTLLLLGSGLLGLAGLRRRS